MTFTQPAWILLALPLGLLWWLYKGPTRPWQIIRALIIIALVLAMAEPRIRSEQQGGLTIVVADRSDSMPTTAQRDQLDAIRSLRSSMRASDRLAVVSFGDRPFVETPPGRTAPDQFTTTPDTGASNIASAIQLALSLAPPDQPARILLISDGAASDTRARELAAIAGGRSIPIDYRPLTRSAQNDLAIERIEAPTSVSLNEAFLLTAWVVAPTEQTASYELLRSGTTIASGTVEVGPAPSRIVFRQAARSATTGDYELILRGSIDDPRPENNRARILVGVRDVRPLLIVTETPGAGLSQLLAGSGLPVETRTPDQADLSLASLAGFGGVILENVPIQSIGLDATQTIAQLVEDAGLGLLMTGGERSFGAGGYYESPLETVLPVSFELRSDRRKLSLAVVVTMDRSGSMAAPVAGGQTKMELAGEAAASVVELLSAFDEFGSIAVDTEPHTIVRLQRLENPGPIVSDLRRVRSMGGGIYVFNALTASVRMLENATAGAKHIILFADAADSEQPGDYVRLLEAASRAGITVSVVGLGSPSDADARFLEDVALKGGGRSYFTTDARLLPQIFTQDTYAASRGAFLKDPVAAALTGALNNLLGVSFQSPPPLGGYNPSYLRDGATLGATSIDEYAAPLVAHWQAGLGRTAIYAGEVDGEYTGEVAGWNQYPEMLTGLARSILQPDEESRSVVAIQRIEGAVARIELYTDPDRPLDTNPSARVVREGSASQPIRTEAFAFRASGADRLIAEVPLRAGEVIAPTVDLGAGETIALSPMILPYEAEHRPASPEQGLRLLRDIADASGGEARTDLAQIWQQLPITTRYQSIAPWLFALAAMLLFVEVLERRTLLLSQMRASQRLKATVEKTRARRAARTQSSAAAATVKPQPKPAASTRSTTPDQPMPGKSNHTGRATRPVKTSPDPSPDDSAETLSAIRSIKRDRDS
jgi:uncharacterized membrane protein